MPRELVHWEVLHRALNVDSATAFPTLQQIAERQKPLVYLSALLHDAPFFLKYGGHPFERMASLLHGGYGDDPLKLLQRLVKIDAPERYELRLAVLLGMLSHYAADVAFHPWVHFIAGNYYDQDRQRRWRAQTRHRLLEVYLDTWIRQSLRYDGPQLVGQLWRQIQRTEREMVVEFLVEAFLPAFEQRTGSALSQDLAAERWQRSIVDMRRCQRMFLSPTFGALIRNLNRMSKGSFDPIDSLFSYRRRHVPEYYREEIEFRNPVSGTEQSTTLDQLMDRGVQLSRELFTLLEPVAASSMGERQVEVEFPVGKSLDFAIAGATYAEGRYFADNESCPDIGE